MRLPKWLKRRKKKKPFKASMPIDNPDFKMIEARYKEQPFFIGIGASKQRKLKGKGEVGMPKITGEYKSQKDLNWQFLYNLKALPEGFMTEEKLKDFMAGTVSVVSGGTAVVTEVTELKEAKPEKLDSLIKKMQKSEAVQFMYFKDRIIGFNQNGELVFEESENSEDKKKRSKKRELTP